MPAIPAACGKAPPILQHCFSGPVSKPRACPMASCGAAALAAAAPAPNGNISFEAGVTGPGVTTQTAYVRYVGTFSNPKLIFRSGNPAPGMAPGVVFNQPDSEFIHPNNEGNEN